ncbi:unnamed protein product [Pylaiella littoralis]
MTLKWTRSRTATAAAVALLTAPSMFASALDLTVANCDDLRSLTGLSNLQEDTTLLLDVPTETFGNPDLNWIACDILTTVRIEGPYKVVVTTDLPNYNFENARFEITDGAEVTFVVDGGLSFNYALSQGSDGGAIYVDNNSAATFDVTGTTSFEGNTAQPGFQGGAVFAAGKVEFMSRVDFISNEVVHFEDSPASYGGAVGVASLGNVDFYDDVDFTANIAQSGGSGGALANFGTVKFWGRSQFLFNTAEGGDIELTTTDAELTYTESRGSGGAIANFGTLIFEKRSEFTSNKATEDVNGENGYGGAIYAAYGSKTEFNRRTIWHDNEAASGGALYNLGEVWLYSNGFIRGNKAVGSIKAEGGHIYNLASVVGGEPIYTGGQISFFGDKTNLREGEAKRGGAYFTGGPGSSTAYSIVPNFIDNFASEFCNDWASGNTDPPSCIVPRG